MTRYLTIEEVNAALVELEEHERTASTEKINSEKSVDVESHKHQGRALAIHEANGQGSANGIEENGEGHEDIDSESESGSGSMDLEGHEDDEEYEDKSENHDDGCDSEDEDAGGPIASDDDEDVQVRQKVVQVDPEEEAEFDRELRALMQESLDSRKLELRCRPTLNMMIPMNVFEGSKDHHGRTMEGESGDETLEEEGSGGNNVRVRVLVKRGNKQQTKQMYIPRDCSLVQSTKQKEAAELEEKQNIKRLILEYNDREEEEFNGPGAQPMNWMQSGTGKPVGRGGSWDGAGRGGGMRPRHHSTVGLYGRRK